MKCEHKRIKRNFPFGKKSKSNKFCKDCGKIVTNKMLEKNKTKRR